ncbi:DUF362 domain-containing protein [Candidatus Poribacteria bacterium]
MSRKFRVSIVRIREQDTYAALKNAVELIGGLEDAIPSSSKILIKPNIVMEPTERGVTNPVVIEAILRLASSTSPKSLMVGEGSADSYTWNSFRINNTFDMASRYGAMTVDLNSDSFVRVEVPKEVGRDYVMLPRTVAEADILISVPIFKLWMGKLPMSLSLKNLFGCYGARYYGHNKNSHELAETAPHRTLQGEVGSERGIHHPSVEQSIAGINLARTSDLTVIDALEGSDGKGNYVRLDMLIVGKNAVATDSVALAVAGFVPHEQEQISLSSQLGLGTCHLEEIEVLGESIEDAYFLLSRLNDNIRELPIEFCLDRLNFNELQIIWKGLKFNGFLQQDKGMSSSRDEVVESILGIIKKEGYIEKALASLPETGLEVLELVKERGGTSGNYFDILDTYTSVHHESNSFWAGLRSMMRLGLAFLFHGQHKCYIILAEGVLSKSL